MAAPIVFAVSNPHGGQASLRPCTAAVGPRMLSIFQIPAEGRRLFDPGRKETSAHHDHVSNPSGGQASLRRCSMTREEAKAICFNSQRRAAVSSTLRINKLKNPYLMFQFPAEGSRLFDARPGVWRGAVHPVSNPSGGQASLRR